jgi:MscS family membrane protein
VDSGGSDRAANIGYSVASLLAGIGIGGAALAFAAKDTLANLFGSLVIFVDKPFAIGEWVKVGAIEGVVEDVSLRVTRVRTFERSLITVPNQDLTTKPIENFSRRERRRIKFTIGVTYDTPIDKIETGIEHVRKIIADHPGLETDEQYVYFTQFSDFSLNILVQCFTLTTDYREYLTISARIADSDQAGVRVAGNWVRFPDAITAYQKPAETGRRGSELADV